MNYSDLKPMDWHFIKMLKALAHANDHRSVYVLAMYWALSYYGEDIIFAVSNKLNGVEPTPSQRLKAALEEPLPLESQLFDRSDNT